MDYKDQRKNHLLRTLIDHREYCLIFLGVIGIFLLPVFIYPFTDLLLPFTLLFEQMGLSYTFVILIFQIIWIVANFFLIAYFLQAERHRRNRRKSI